MSAPLLSEYQTLRQEISDNSKNVATVFLANTTVTAALIGYGLSVEDVDSAVFLTPFAVLIPSLFYIASQLESTTRISQYLRVVLEPRIGLLWQQRWFDLRKKAKIPHRRKFILSVSGLYGTLGVVCVLLAAEGWKHELHFVAVVAPLAALLVWPIVLVRRAFSMAFRDAYAAAWTELETEPKTE